MANIAMVLKGDIRFDGRVRKEIGSLSRVGHKIDLIVSDFYGQPSDVGSLQATVHYIPMTLWRSSARNFVEQLIFNYKAAAILEALRPSHIHCHDLSSLLAGVWAKNRLKSNLIFDAHELMPESLWGVKERIWNLIERRCVKQCDYIIMPESNRIEYFKKKYRHISEPALLQNFPRKDEIPDKKFDIFRCIYPIRESQKIILYTGLIAAFRHVEDLILSLTHCSDDFVLIILGESYKGYSEVLRLKVDQLGLVDRVFFHQAVPNSEILQYMASCDIGTAFYRNTDLNNFYCASNKLYEYIALNKPVITNNYPGLLAAVERFSQGVCLDEINPKTLATAYLRASDTTLLTPGASKHFWEDEEHVLNDLYRN